VRFLLLLLSVGWLRAAGSPPVLVIVNDQSSLSRSIGEYYARKRGITPDHVCRIQTKTLEDISRQEYENTILAPVLRCLAQGNLRESVLYLVTTGGVPLRISGSDAPGGDLASVDSELALAYQIAKGVKPPTAGFVPNPFFGQKDVPFTHARFPIYLVNRLAAYDFQTVRKMIDDAVAARNTGKFVIDAKRWDSTPGNGWLRDTAAFLPKDRVVFDETERIVENAKNVIGYASWGSNDPDRKQRFVKFSWLPGAVATEFVSTNGRTLSKPPDSWTLGRWNEPKTMFAGTPQSMAADYLMEGASGVTGHVSEPYLQMCPRPDVLLPAYFHGRNWAEAAWMSIPVLSWRNIVLGDPLMTLGKP
jgi:uncharacterized protein (TIGR03790 family)